MASLLGDIGGTNARFTIGLADSGDDHAKTYRCADYPDLASIIETFIASLPDSLKPRNGAICVAGPVKGPTAEMTNLPWSVDADVLRNRFSLEFLFLVNDFTAQALAIPYLGEADLFALDRMEAPAGRAMAVLGPGTGLGVSALVPTPDGRWSPLTTEGGHVTMASRTGEEARVLQVLADRYGHVSAERVVSGQGIENIHKALCQITGTPDPEMSAQQIVDSVLTGTEGLPAQTLNLFCGFLGTVASNLALTIGAQGGVFLAGGILPRMPDLVAASNFRSRFEDKGRFREYLSPIPVRIIMHPYPAFLGLAALARDRYSRN
ncbi:MAG: glucokinase [Rhodospirillales bacterium]